MQWNRDSSPVPDVQSFEEEKTVLCAEQLQQVKRQTGNGWQVLQCCGEAS